MFRVFLFGNQHLVVTGASQPFSVYSGRNAAGQPVYEVVTFDNAESVPSTAGYVVPPKSAFTVKNSGSGSETVGTWQRDWWWEVDKANDYKECKTCTPYDYYRYYAKVRGGVLQQFAGDPDAGYKRLWIEIDRYDSGWTTTGMTEFESARPEESVAGPNNVSLTVGFGTTYSVNIGIPPIGVGGAVSSSYGGTMYLSTEWWHPVIRSELGSGGVQWCRYQSDEFGGTKSIAARSRSGWPRTPPTADTAPFEACRTTRPTARRSDHGVGGYPCAPSCLRPPASSVLAGPRCVYRFLLHRRWAVAARAFGVAAVRRREDRSRCPSRRLLHARSLGRCRHTDRDRGALHEPRSARR